MIAALSAARIRSRASGRGSTGRENWVSSEGAAACGERASIATETGWRARAWPAKRTWAAPQCGQNEELSSTPP